MVVSKEAEKVSIGIWGKMEEITILLLLVTITMTVTVVAEPSSMQSAVEQQQNLLDGAIGLRCLTIIN